MIPGEYFIHNETITINSNRETIAIKVSNTGDRPVQVGSHFHFFEVNKCLCFDREKAFGLRLDIPSGTSVRFEPGEEKEIELIPVGGEKTIHGLNDLTAGNLEEKDILKRALIKGKSLKFKGVE